MASYLPEQFDEAERARLAPFVTDVDGRVFGLVGLDEEVVAALFARYSRTSRSLRRTLLEEFAPRVEDAVRAGVGRERTEALLARVIGEYGDDSVAQLAVVHFAIEQIPALLARRIERGRLAAYLEQSTRYVPLATRRSDGSWPAYVPDGLAPRAARAYDEAIEASFRAYAAVLEAVEDHLAKLDPPADAPARRAQRAAALDAARGLLPLAVLTNVGVVASAQAAERLVWRLRADATPGASEVADEIARVLGVLVPGLTQRMDRPDRGGRMVEYLRETRGGVEVPWHWNTAIVEPSVRIVRADEDAERRVAAWMLFERGEVDSVDQGLAAVEARGEEGLDALFVAGVGHRANRRHLPGRPFEAAVYELEITCDIGAFRDLARHRILTLLEPPLVPGRGFALSDLVVDAGVAPLVLEHWERLGPLVASVVAEAGPSVGRLLLPFATQIRFAVVVNARELMHLVELRSQPQGHPVYRRIAIEAWRALEAVGHRRIAGAMEFVDTEGYTVGRLAAERRSEVRSMQSGRISGADPLS
ncbi:thymidylate synthase complementing protein ThyX [Acidimicrobium ferrooxidans DSM 10331]|uniref:Thymidylate synthase complementing protein ThyX n=1 Tax=Acidimicrobium ferrooxidans (strain DSM 10331 / JCM 15462 / NBRC 103882 / ICP) TaxID=525909 RepID=C7LYQ6_ACIFD|nr:FAD-dependent thymidylate synthase [Acidimicrobium ferrooxidans]ACU53864.1 thymidylate synthase complementing protein ThyX [Acidimicrobium ferrooxidans DSM 10331]